MKNSSESFSAVIYLIFFYDNLLDSDPVSYCIVSMANSITHWVLPKNNFL